MISSSRIGLLRAGSALAIAPDASVAGGTHARGLDERDAPGMERSLGALVDESDPPEKLSSAAKVADLVWTAPRARGQD